MSTTTILEQNVLYEPRFPRTLPLTQATTSHADDVVSRLLASDPDLKAVGISYHIDEWGKVAFVCLATSTSAVLIKFSKRAQVSKNGAFAALLTGQYPQAGTFPPQPIALVGFKMAHTVLQVSHATKIAVKAIDLYNAFKSRCPSDIVSQQLTEKSNSWGICRLWLGDEKVAPRDVALQAWLAALVGRNRFQEIQNSHALNAERLPYLERSCLSKLVLQVDILERNKPTEMINDFEKAGTTKDGGYEILNTRFVTRVRRSNQTQVVLQDESGNEFIGKTKRVEGKTTTLGFKQSLRPTTAVQRITVRGREEANSSEKACYDLLFRVLAGIQRLPRSTLVKKIWFPNIHCAWSLNLPTVKGSTLQSVLELHKLNESQRCAAEAMTGESPIVVVHGPPGTGKTTTIAASARVWDLSKCPGWIVAHSNVAVKNIAEKLAKKDVDFKLIVSKEFYEEWHEHLYTGVKSRLIQSDELVDDKVGIDRRLLGSRIILSTLSMLSNPTLRLCGAFDLVPLQRLVIDEASQINIFEFLHIFHEHHDKLQKVCFFGDPSQLPPFGKEEAPTIQTIFDLAHVMQNSRSVFLDTQYRMPTTIGSFISRSVYENKLNSVHTIRTPGCLAFVHAGKTGEERSGKSTRNTGEVEAIVHLVRNYYARCEDFCVITPYDAQRAAIQDALKRERLPWDKVFNLDSFQGNEAEYVLVSVVRSDKPGFLTSLNRMNVMLTRCKMGMVIVSNKGFLGKGGSGHKTLLGKLYNHWKVEHHANTDPWIDWRSISEASVDLPGVPARNPSGIVRTTASASVNFSLSDGMDSLSITSRSGVAQPASSSTLYRRMMGPLGSQAVPVAQVPGPSFQATVAPSGTAASTSSKGKRTRTRRTDVPSQMLVMQDGADR